MRLHPTGEVAAKAGMVVMLCTLLVWLYASTAAGLATEWMSSPDASYGAILAVIAAGTIWTRRHAIRAAAANPSGFATGASVLGLGLLTFLIARFGADVFVTRISLVLVAAGLLWCVAGSAAARICAAPILFLLLAIPLPALVVNAITLPLQLAASRMAEWMLNAAQIPVFRDGNILELRSTSLEVAEACSGLRSVISLTAIGCLVAWAAERTMWRRALVIGSALPIALGFNAVRIAATGAACEVWGPSAASGRWHTFAGWLTFVAALVVLGRVQRALPSRPIRREATLPEVASA